MASYINASYARAKHRGEQGNLISDAIMVTQKAGWATGDVIAIDTGPWDMLYTSMRVVRADLTDGLTVKVGVRELQGNFIDDDYFGTQLISAAGVTELITLPKEVLDSNGKKISHDLIVTLTGTLTVGESFWIISEKVCFGAPV